MRRIRVSKRRTGAAIVGLLILGGSAIALWTVERVDPTVATVETARDALVHFDDLAAAAEARVSLASLRSTIEDQPAPDRNGAHARRVAAQLAASFGSPRRDRAPEWDAAATRVAELRSQLQAADPQALATITAIEASLRAVAP
jgi:hypothetical protein